MPYNPERRVRKTARTLIYTAIFGPQDAIGRNGERRTGVTKRPNDPFTDHTRQRPIGWNVADMQDTWDNNYGAAQFSPAQSTALQDEMWRLHVDGPKQKALDTNAQGEVIV